EYMGLEAVEPLAAAAEEKQLPGCRIIRGDFVHDPQLMEVGADVILFSGSLNTLDVQDFYAALSAAHRAARHAVVFNFLASPSLAAAMYLTWHTVQSVLAFAGKLTNDVGLWEDYLSGDATVAMRIAARPTT